MVYHHHHHHGHWLHACRSATARRGSKAGHGAAGQQQQEGDSWPFLLWQCSRLLLLDLSAKHGFFQVGTDGGRGAGLGGPAGWLAE